MFLGDRVQVRRVVGGRLRVGHPELAAPQALLDVERREDDLCQKKKFMIRSTWSMVNRSEK